MLRHPCGKSHREIHHARPSATLAPVSGIRPSSHGPSFLEALNPSFRQTRDRSVVGRSAAFSGPAYETLMLNTAFLGPVKLTLPMFVPGQRAALTLAVRNLHQNPREVQIHLLDAQQYNLSADLQYDVNALERAAPMALDVQLNRRAYRDSLVLRAALAERDGDPAKAQEWLAKGQIRAVPASLRSCRRSQILKWLQQVLALLAPVDILFGLKQFVRFLDAKMQISGLGQPVLVAICNVPRLDNAFFWRRVHGVRQRRIPVLPSGVPGRHRPRDGPRRHRRAVSLEVPGPLRSSERVFRRRDRHLLRVLRLQQVQPQQKIRRRPDRYGSAGLRDRRRPRRPGPVPPQHGGTGKRPVSPAFFRPRPVLRRPQLGFRLRGRPRQLRHPERPVLPPRPKNRPRSGDAALLSAAQSQSDARDLHFCRVRRSAPPLRSEFQMRPRLSGTRGNGQHPPARSADPSPSSRPSSVLRPTPIRRRSPNRKKRIRQRAGWRR
mmetsp:Transcript_22931/g.45337  ORF Transcript_22931/g.45337 Transcript_22931/m.45337 type:complete len:492 (+) Transcript_22931:76-1551(+)